MDTKEVFLNSLHRNIIKAFERKKMRYLKKPFIYLIEKNCLSGKSWAYLKKIANDKKISNKEFEKIFQDYFINNGIFFEKPVKKIDNSSKRVKKYRQKQKEKGLKSVFLYLDDKNHSKLKKIASEQNMSFSEIISNLLRDL